MTEPFIREDGLPTIGLALIAKDEAETLPRLLDSVGWGLSSSDDIFPIADQALEDQPNPMAEIDGKAVDFVVIADTGSTDRTKEIARARGCKVIDIAWTDNFAEARQASYDALPGWIDLSLWADADDIIEGAEKLRQLGAIVMTNPGVSGTLHRYDYARDDAGNTVCELWRERLVRYNHGEKWMLPVHEVLQVPGALVHVEDGVWHHHQPPERERDPERNYKILRKSHEAATAKQEQPDLRTVAYLGTEALGLGRPEEAVELFKDYLGRQDPNASEERCQIAHKLSIALRALREGEKDLPSQRIEESIEAGHLAVHERPDWPDGYIDLAELSLRREESERALWFCEQAMAREIPKTLLIINPLEYRYQPLLMRSVALAKLGRVEEAFDATQAALQITPYRDDLKSQAGMVGEQLKRKQAVETVLTLRETLIRHDENLAANALMQDAVPYFVRNDPAIAQARLDSREMTLHAANPALYGSYYRENPGETPFEAQGVPVADAHEHFHRVKFLREGLDKYVVDHGSFDVGETIEVKTALRILDLSANDGWMLVNLAEGGYGVDGELAGMDLNRDAATRAEQRLSGSMAASGANGRIVCDDLHKAAEHFEPESFDVVVLFETLEHVPDPAATLDAMVRMVKPGGLCFISTPAGAYENGNVPGWATVESKGHLRAMTPAEVSGLLAERGKITAMETEQRLIVASMEPRPRKGKIVFFAGPADCRPEQITETGLGGSETALAKMAEHFARRGYVVKVFAGEGGGVRQDHLTVEGQHEEGEVLYEPWTAWDPGERCELFISLRIPEAFDRTINAERRLLWLHDADYGERLTEQRASRTTHVAMLSDFHREIMVERYPWIEDKVFLTRNGIETSYFREAIAA